MADTIPTLAYAVERDIDLIVIEELACNRHFTNRLLSRMGVDVGGVKSSRVLHSWRRTENRREIDILLECALRSGKRGLVLIENKLDTDPQPLQGESYQEECAVLKGQSDVAFAFSLLIAPKHYLSEKPDFAAKFDQAWSYQDIAKALAERAAEAGGEVALRLHHRVKLLDQAIDKARRPYEKIVNKRNSNFHGDYWKFARAVDRRLAPNSLDSKKKAGHTVPSESVSMIFNLPQSLGALATRLGISRFSHELGRGEDHRTHYVAVTFRGKGAAYLASREIFDRFLADTPYRFSSKAPSKAKPNPGLTLSVETPAVNGQLAFDEVKGDITLGLGAAQTLIQWLQANQAAIHNLLK